MAGKIQIGGGAMEYAGYTWWEEDYEGYRTDSNNYTPGAVAYNWLVTRVSPSMPIDELFEASECLDMIYDYVQRYPVDEFTLNLFKLFVIVDHDLKSLIWEFISLIRDYLCEDHPSVKVYTVELIYRYFQFRDSNKYL
jgi:hypothetical protein